MSMLLINVTVLAGPDKFQLASYVANSSLIMKECPGPNECNWVGNKIRIGLNEFMFGKDSSTITGVHFSIQTSEGKLMYFNGFSGHNTTVL